MHGTSVVATCCQLCSTRWTQRNARAVDKDNDNLGRRRSTTLTVPATVDGQLITLIVRLCIKHDSVARFHLQRLILVSALCRRWRSGSRTVAPSGRSRTRAWTSTAPRRRHRHRRPRPPHSRDLLACRRSATRYSWPASTPGQHCPPPRPVCNTTGWTTACTTAACCSCSAQSHHHHHHHQ